MKTWIHRWGPAVLVMAIIFIASSTPASEVPGFGFWDFVVKKGGHMLGYALLAAAYYHALTNRQDSTKHRFALALCLSVLYAASDEWHQRFTPGRTASIMDVGIDAAGSLLGAAMLRWKQKRPAI